MKRHWGLMVVICAIACTAASAVWFHTPSAVELMPYASANDNLKNYADHLHLSRETEKQGWPATPAVWNVPPVNNEPTRSDLGYWSKTKQPTPMWVDLPPALSEPEPEPGEAPTHGESKLRWGAPVVRKVPEQLLEQMQRMAYLERKIKETNQISKLLLDKQIEKINQIKIKQQGHVDTVLEGVETDAAVIKSKIEELHTKPGPVGDEGPQGIQGNPGKNGLPGKYVLPPHQPFPFPSTIFPTFARRLTSSSSSRISVLTSLSSPRREGAPGPPGFPGPRGFQGPQGDPGDAYYRG